MSEILKHPDFAADWCQEIIHDPDYKEIRFHSRENVPSKTGTMGNAFFGEKLATADTIRAVAPFINRNSKPDYPETLTLFSLGSAINGHPELVSFAANTHVRTFIDLSQAHGGFHAILLDEVMGSKTMILFECRFPYKIDTLRSGPLCQKLTYTQDTVGHGNIVIFTVDLNVKYKHPLRTPCTILSRGWVEKREGRKIWARATLEDGNGLLLSEASCLFIQEKSNL